MLQTGAVVEGMSKIDVYETSSCFHLIESYQHSSCSVVDEVWCAVGRRGNLKKRSSMSTGGTFIIIYLLERGRTICVISAAFLQSLVSLLDRSPEECCTKDFIRLSNGIIEFCVNT